MLYIHLGRNNVGNGLKLVSFSLCMCVWRMVMYLCNPGGGPSINIRYGPIRSSHSGSIAIALGSWMGRLGLCSKFVCNKSMLTNVYRTLIYTQESLLLRSTCIKICNFSIRILKYYLRLVRLFKKCSRWMDTPCRIHEVHKENTLLILALFSFLYSWHIIYYSGKSMDIRYSRIEKYIWLNDEAPLWSCLSFTRVTQSYNDIHSLTLSIIHLLR